jgi:hypothetical protein
MEGLLQRAVRRQVRGNYTKRGGEGSTRHRERMSPAR